MIDLVIEGGTVVDGSGGPSKQASVAIDKGRIVRIGPGERVAAAQTIDAAGLVVAPGFVDIHTHYDAQVFWDAACTPSSLHGVTTVFAGNCGFSIAPLGDDPEYLMRLLSRVEGIPLEALEHGVPWNWRSFPQYLDAVQARGPAVNFGVLVGHSALRRAVLGQRSHDPAPRADEIDAMRRLLVEGLRAGGAGFSSSWAATHLDGNGDPVPSRLAGSDELVTLSGALAGFPGSQLEFIPTNGEFEERHMDVMTRMALAAGAPLNWNVLIPRSMAWIENRLSASDYAKERGAEVLGLSYPDVMRTRASFLSSSFDSVPNWGSVMALAADKKLAALADPGERAKLRAGALAAPVGLARDFEDMEVCDTFHPSNEKFRGRRIRAIAEETGRDPYDVLFDIVIADELRTGFLPKSQADDEAGWKARTATWSDPRVIIGASDGGAHLDILSTFDYPVRYLATQRERNGLSLEETVRQLTDVPARLYRLRDRGRLAVGNWADVVVFDAKSIAPGHVRFRNDLPAGAGRLYAEPRGIAQVLVNGRPIVRDGRLTGETPGRMLRLGRPAH